VSDKLRKQLEVERQQLNRLVAEHRILLDSCATKEPTPIEVSALATFLHSFYSGIENSLKRIALEIDDGVPSGDAWHRQLLTLMAKATAAGFPTFLSPSLFLSFRLVENGRLGTQGRANFEMFEMEVDRFFDYLRLCP
jgi:hypothetical protein